MKALLALLLMATPVYAQCADRQFMVKHLEKAWQEQPEYIGIANSGGVMEVLTSATGTFTIIITLPDGRTCPIIAGENWEKLPKTEILKGDPA